MARDEDEDDRDPFDLPRMGMDEAAGVAWVQACVDALAEGRIGTKKFAALMAASSKVATLAKHYHERTELKDMEEILREMRELDAKAEKRAEEVQQGRRPH